MWRAFLAIPLFIPLGILAEKLDDRFMEWQQNRMLKRINREGHL